ncbi:MFS transporter [Aestuariibacter halophilus]|uniref:MFS transporter n=1 Tax=Fluctibacter halophilus TaxID=226011 RepID=A0ABS8G5G9_9ALTE|nr:VC0807 family protein [Aestuariibacter halophilus]MCC2614919.1 MFS transporter [Aestuariibacter halophilus]
MSQPSAPQTKQQPQQGGFFGNLVFNIILPVVIMTYLSPEDRLGPAWSIVAALIFPIGFGIYDLIKAGKVNGFSVLGIVSVLLTGGISLLELPAEYIAIKEATIPGLIGIAVLISQYTGKPLVKMLILNERLVDWPALNTMLDEKRCQEAFNKKINNSAYIVASSFFLSSALNYILAKLILVSPPGTPAYTEELGRMTALSYPVIVIPSMILLMAALWYLFAQIKKLTGHSLEDFLIEQQK